MPIPLEYRNKSQRRWPIKLPPFKWANRGLLLAAMVLLPLTGMLLYVGPAWSNVFLRLLTDGPLTILWLVGAIGWGLLTIRWTWIWKQDLPVALFIATATGAGLGTMSLIILGLGLGGLFNAVTAWSLVAAGVIAVLLLFKGTSRATIKLWLLEPVKWKWLWLIMTPLLTLILTAAMVPPGMLWTPEEPHGYDVVEYHLQVPREWYELHRIVPLHHNIFSYVPFNVEMHYLLAMHLCHGPWAGMYMSQLMHMAFIMMTLVAVYGFATRVSGQASAVIATLATLSVPWIIQLAPISYDEGGFLLFGVLAIGWALKATFEMSHQLSYFALAGTFAGFAAGSKLTAVPEILIAVPSVAVLSTIYRKLSGREPVNIGPSLIGILLFAIFATASFGPWLVRNLIWAHNPVFPELMKQLGRNGLDADQVERWESSLKPPLSERSVAARAERFWTEVIRGWQFGYLLLPLAAVAAALSFRRPETWFLLGLLLILTVFWLSMTHLQGRFYILSAPIAAMLIARIDWRKAAPIVAILLFFFAAEGWIRINSQLFSRLYGPTGTGGGLIQSAGEFQPLGAEDLRWLIPEPLYKLPTDKTLILLGEARAFNYQIPMSRLRYRTVFDVPDGPDIVTAWEGYRPATSDEWLLIDPAELIRFRRTYYGLPTVPPEIEHARGPIIIKR